MATTDPTDTTDLRPRLPRSGKDAAYDEFADLLNQLRFAPRGGRIWLGEQRMLLLHSKAMASLREELIDALGINRARGFLTRMGYISGSLDAELAKKLERGRTATEAFQVGPRLHSLAGVVYVEEVRTEIDIARGHYLGEYLWHDSSEDEGHIAKYGIGTEPVCWTQIGYACGYTSVFMGRPIIFREVECRAMGSAHCRIIGKPIEQWDDADEDLRYLRAEPLADQFPFERPDGHLPAVTPVTVQVTNESPAPDKLTAPDKGASIADRHLMVGASAGFKAACHLLNRVADTDTPVLLSGESGVGKELFARNLHHLSPRAARPFIAVNCAAIPADLIEAELFGVEKGAYTGASQSRPGRFERADGGTLFLDEINSLGLAAQGKLLRAVQEMEIERIGDVRTRQVNVRVVAASNVPLRDLVDQGKFRTDLFYRLNVFPIHIPPLRHRREDIPLLLHFFRQRISRRLGKQVPGFTERAINAVLDYDWPGNIRELENAVERGIILTDPGEAIDLSSLFPYGETPQNLVLANQETELTEAGNRLFEQFRRSGLDFDNLEARLLAEAVKEADGNLSAAARSVGLSRAQLAYRLQKHGLHD